MSKEIKLGIFGILVIFAVVYGYRFLAGENVFGSSKTYYIYVDDAKSLIRSSPIFYKGFQVGTVSDIAFIEKEGGTKVQVALRIDEPITIKTDAIAQIEGAIMGSTAIYLKMKDQSAAGILPHGGTLKGHPMNMLETMIGSPDDLSPYAQIIKNGLVSAYDTISVQAKDPTGPGVGKMFYDVDIILADMKVTTRNLNKLIRTSNTHVATILADLSAVTANLKNSNSAINNIMANTEGITQKLNNAGLDSTIIGANAAIATLKETLLSSNQLLASFEALAKKANTGDGSLAKLLNDPELYMNLAKVSKNTDLLLQDLRLNPKRYVNVSVFGKKQKKYEVPENDPAFKD